MPTILVYIYTSQYSKGVVRVGVCSICSIRLIIFCVSEQLFPMAVVPVRIHTLHDLFVLPRDFRFGFAQVRQVAEIVNKIRLDAGGSFHWRLLFCNEGLDFLRNVYEANAQLLFKLTNAASVMSICQDATLPEARDLVLFRDACYAVKEAYDTFAADDTAPRAPAPAEIHASTE